MTMITLDRAECSIVLVCSACPGWSELTSTLDAAHRCAADHEAEQHPDSKLARERARKHRMRRAEQSAK